MKFFRNYFFSGLLFWLPLGITFLIINFFVHSMDGLIPKKYSPEILFGFDIPGFGFIIVFVIILITGLFLTNFLGKYFLSLWNKFLTKIPVINTIYSTIKKLSDTVFKSDNDNFKKVVLIEYPKKDLWTFAFQTADYRSKIEKTIGEEVVNIYVPTTPNPTSGFFLMLPKSQVKEVDMSVDEALKTIISMGIIKPNYKKD